MLTFCDVADGGDLVTEACGTFEVEVVGGGGHVGLDAVEDFVGAAFEEEDGFVDDFFVFGGLNTVVDVRVIEIR